MAFGENEDYQFSVPIDDNLDEGRRRTSQRAELLAALYGVRLMRSRSTQFAAADKQEGASDEHS